MPEKSDVCPFLIKITTLRVVIFQPLFLLATMAVAAERTAVIDNTGAFGCTSWAAWHEYTLASLTSKGAHMSKLCPIRLKAGTRVEVIEEDSGEGASLVRAGGMQWYVDNQRLK
jgi:hypothetical protein